MEDKRRRVELSNSGSEYENNKREQYKIKKVNKGLDGKVSANNQCSPSAV